MELSIADISTLSSRFVELRTPVSVPSEETTESVRDLKERACRRFVQKARRIIDDCGFEMAWRRSEFFIVSFNSSQQTDGFRFHEPKRKAKSCSNKYKARFNVFAGVFDANEAKYILESSSH